MTIFAAGDKRDDENLLGTVGALPEPAVALLLDGIQKVSADDLGGCLRTLAFLLTENLLQLVTIPIGIGFLRLFAVVCVNILLSSTTVQG